MSRPYIEQDLIWKVQVDSYQREIERYGIGAMEQAEELFFHDSRMIVDMLDMIAGDEGEKYRWFFALRAIDTLLDDFHLKWLKDFLMWERQESKSKCDTAIMNHLLEIIGLDSGPL